MSKLNRQSGNTALRDATLPKNPDANGLKVVDSAAASTGIAATKAHNQMAVKVDLQEASVFEKNEGEVKDVAITNSYTLVIRKNGEVENEYVVYDESGKILPVRLPPFSTTCKDLAAAVPKSYVITLDQQVTWDSGYIFYSELPRKLSLPNETAAEIRANLLKSFNFQNNDNRHLSNTNLLSNQDAVLYSPPSDIKSDHSKTRLIMQHGRELHIYETVDAGGKVLTPENWKYITIPDLGKINEADLENKPFLREFMETGKGRLLGKSTRAISNERGILNVIDTQKNERVYSSACAGYAVDPVDNNTVYYLTPDGKNICIFAADKAALTQTAIETRELNLIGEVQDLRFDPQGNFFLVQIKNQNESDFGTSEQTSLIILDKNTFEQVGEVADVEGQFDIDNLGNICYVDNDKKLRLAQTNFMTFPRGGIEELQRQKQAKLIELSKSVAVLELPVLPEGSSIDPKNATNSQLLTEMAKGVNDRFSDSLEKAKTAETLDKITRQIDLLKQKPQFAEYPEIFSQIEGRILQRRSQLKSNELKQKITDYRLQLGNATNFSEVLDAEPVLAEIQILRRGILISDVEERKKIDAEILGLEGLTTSKSTQYSANIGAALKTKFTKLESLIAESGTVDELRAVSASKDALDFNSLRISLPDPKESQQWKKNYNDAVAKKSAALEEKLALENTRQLGRALAQVEELREIFDGISQAVQSEVKNPLAISNWRKTNPLIKSFEDRIRIMPEGLRQREQEKLDKLLAGKTAELESRAQVQSQNQIGSDAETVKFGSESFPVYQSLPGETLNNIPKFSPRWVVNDFTKEQLGRIARQCRTQMEQAEGILILEGEAGCGKNVLFDMFAHFTQRNVYTFNAHKQADKADLTYEYEFSPEKGTFRDDSKFIEMLKTPGAIVVIDEINTLPPGLTKMLNPLLDYRRVLPLPDGRVVKVDPSVIIVATMNPQNYLGVSRLSQEVISRSRVLEVGYPPEKERGKFTAYEAEIMAKSVNCLKGVSGKELHAMWHYVVNNDKTNNGSQFLTTEREAAIKNLHQVVKTANLVREAYKAYRSGRNNDAIEFVFSLRESTAIAIELNYGSDVKKAIREVVLPKIGDLEERERVRAIIDNV